MGNAGNFASCSLSRTRNVCFPLQKTLLYTIARKFEFLGRRTAANERGSVSVDLPWNQFWSRYLISVDPTRARTLPFFHNFRFFAVDDENGSLSSSVRENFIKIIAILNAYRRRVTLLTLSLFSDRSHDNNSFKQIYYRYRHNLSVYQTLNQIH